MSDKTMEIILPEEIAHYEGELRYFIDSMIRKLYVNRHKGFGEHTTFEQSLHLIQGELHELEDAASRGEAQFAAYMETVDIANTALIAALVLSRMTKDEYKKLKHAETESGKQERQAEESIAAAARSSLGDHPDHSQANRGGTQPRGGSDSLVASPVDGQSHGPYRWHPHSRNRT